MEIRGRRGARADKSIGTFWRVNNVHFMMTIEMTLKEQLWWYTQEIVCLETQNPDRGAGTEWLSTPI